MKEVQRQLDIHFNKDKNCGDEGFYFIMRESNVTSIKRYRDGGESTVIAGTINMLDYFVDGMKHLKYRGSVV